MMDNFERILYSKKINRQIEGFVNKLYTGKSGLLVLIAPASRCNFQCKYCSAMAYRHVNERFRYNREIIYRTLDVVLDFKERFPHSSIEIVFHGYEPTQIPQKEYEEFDKRVRESGFHPKDPKKGRPILLSIQTNGYLMTPRRIDWFVENGWSIGWSIDGPKEIHDFNRPLLGGYPTYDRVIKNFRYYREKTGGKVGVISVMTKKHIEFGPEVYYNWLKEEKIRWADIHIPFIPHDLPYAKEIKFSVKEAIEYLTKLYELWANDTYELELHPFASIVQAMVTGRHANRFCMFKGTCHKVLFVDNNGNLHMCDRMSYSYNLNINNIKRLEEVFFTRAMRLHLARQYVLQRYSDCKKCKYFPICRGGCPAEAITTSVYHRGAIFNIPQYNKTHNCPIWKALFAYIEKDLRQRGVKTIFDK